MLVSAILILAFIAHLFIGGVVDGEEFSPDDFSRRKFSYNVMPVFNICLWGIRYSDVTPVFEQTLFADGLLDSDSAKAWKKGKAKKWHLVSDSASNPESRDFDAQLLVRFLDIRNSEHESVWAKWNEDHPELAKMLWPVVADMARNNLYVELTDIMAQALSVSDENEDEFERFVNEHSRSALANRADDAKSEPAEAEDSEQTSSVNR